MNQNSISRSPDVGAAPSPQIMNGPRGVRQHPATAGIFQPVPLWLMMLSMIFMLMGLNSIYPLLTTACAVTLPICASLLLFRGESPILFACCATQWMQIAIALVYCDFTGVDLSSVLQAPEVDRAAAYCLAATLALALGMRVALSSSQRNEIVGNVVLSNSQHWNMTRVFQMWLICFVVGSIADAVGWYVTALHQLLLPLANLKWVFFFILSYLAMTRKSGYGMFASMVLLEFAGGFLGPFSNFKEGLMMLLIVVVALRRRVNGAIVIVAVPVVVVGVCAAVFWSSIKQDYRAVVFGIDGNSNVSKAERTLRKFSWLADRISRMEAADFENGAKSLIARVQYLSLVGQTLSHVPHYEPYAKGELWLGAIRHVLTPRIIFRNKAVLDDSERARRFTGLRLAGREEGTSIGIGYVAESYADLGFPGMFVPIFLLGIFMGRMYQVPLRNRSSALLGTGMATAMLFSHVQMLEKSNVKIFGGLVVLCLAYWTLNRVFGVSLVRWLTRRP